MKVFVAVKASKSSEAGMLPDVELMTAMGKFNEALIEAGIMVDGAGLTPSSRGARVRFSGQQRIVTDGPFTETKELVAGFWIWNVRSMEEAIEWVKKCPNPMPEDSDIEIRPIAEAEDFGDAFTQELRENEAVMRAQTLGLNAPHFVDAGPMVIGGLQASYNCETRTAIPQHWQRFVEQANALKCMQGKDMYGVCWNTTPEGNFEYLSGAPIDPSEDLPASLSKLELTARRYAVFPHTQHVSAIPQTVDTIWRKWVKDCGLSIAEAPCLERYTLEFDPVAGMGGMEIWIPLEAE